MNLPAIVVRLVGLWILVGACVKLFAGSPADLPEILQGLPIALALTFKLAVALELAIGLLALLRPSRGWLPLALVTLAFLVVLTTQVAGGDESCGCFGAAVTISPVVMLVIDGVALLALLLVRPWRRERDRGEAPWGLTALLVLAVLPLPWVFDREQTTADVVAGGGTGYVVLGWQDFEGKLLRETNLWPVLKGRARIGEGAIVIYAASCEVCKEHIAMMDTSFQPVVFLELPKIAPDDPDVVGPLPTGSNITVQKLPDATWSDVTPPIHIEVAEGRVTGVWQGHDATEHLFDDK